MHSFVQFQSFEMSLSIKESDEKRIVTTQFHHSKISKTQYSQMTTRIRWKSSHPSLLPD